MKNPKRIAWCILPACMAAIMAGCASPTVVQEHQVGDQDLSCDQLVLALQEARNFESQARGERGATGTNVAAALFFWPGLLATYANSGDAIEAAQERQRYLTTIHEGKNCARTEVQSAPAAPVPSVPGQTTAPGTFTVAAVSGAPAFPEPVAQGTPLHTFLNGTALTVIETTPDGRWYKVVIPDGRAAYVPSVNVQSP